MNIYNVNEINSYVDTLCLNMFPKPFYNRKSSLVATSQSSVTFREMRGRSFYGLVIVACHFSQCGFPEVTAKL